MTRHRLTGSLLPLVPCLGIFLLVGIVFLAARAPRTWASNWTTPVYSATNSSVRPYGAVNVGTNAWDTLWYDDEHFRLLFHRAGSARTLTVDTGDIDQPSLLRRGKTDLALWILNLNGATQLKEAILRPGAPAVIRTLISGAIPIEHPYLFAGTGGAADAVFSWQRDGNFDVYLARVPLSASVPFAPRRLTRSQYYAFYPRAVTDKHGNVDLVYLDSCCGQTGWNVLFDQFSAAARPLRAPQRLVSVRYNGEAPDVPEWGEALALDRSGAVWVAVSGQVSAWLAHVNPNGRLAAPPQPFESVADAPSLSISASDGGVVAWQQDYELGSFLMSARFDRSGRLGTPERLEYISGSQAYPITALRAGNPEVIWETSTHTGANGFERAAYRSAAGPSVLQRLGLGLGNPWEEIGVLTMGGFTVAALTTAVNVLDLLVLAVAGLLLLRLLRPFPGRWAMLASFLTVAYYAIFVTPGEPVLFLSTVPSLGLGVRPFGWVAAIAAFLLMIWGGTRLFRRLEDLYRVAATAVLGMYFFAFLESVIFVQQRLGFI